MKKNILISFIVIVCTSCYSHQIYFDLENQTINSCNPNGLKYLDIRNDSLKIDFRLNWKEDIKNIPKSIKLANVQDGYLITEGWGRRKAFSKNILLEKSAAYEIKVFGGDAGPYMITVTTDENGKVVSTSHGSCD